MTEHNDNKHLIRNYFDMSFGQFGVAIGIVLGRFLNMNNVPMLLQMQYRFMFCAAILYLLSSVFDRKTKCNVFKKFDKRDWILIFFQGITGTILFNLFMLGGLKYTTASVAGIIASTLPIFVAILSLIFLKEKFSRRKWFAIILAVIGVAILHFDSSSAGHGGVSSNFYIGALLVILAMLPEAMYTILVKMQKFTLPYLQQAYLINLIGAICNIPIWLIFEGTESLELFTNLNLILLLSLSSSGSMMFYFYWNRGIRGVSAATAAIFTSVMPISAATMGIIGLEEKMSSYYVISMIVIFSSIVVGSYSKKKKVETYI